MFFFKLIVFIYYFVLIYHMTSFMKYSQICDRKVPAYDISSTKSYALSLLTSKLRPEKKSFLTYQVIASAILGISLTESVM